MYLKKHYHQNADGSVGDVKGVELKSKLKTRAHLTPELVRKAVKQGWITISGNKLTVSFVNAPSVTYTIKREPGYYCLHCGIELEDANQVLDDGKTVGQQHVAAVHSNSESPDASNPAGYERINFYDCVKE
jgi:hypothetical protein